ncbi:MAG TPA: ATP-binding protein [Thermoanaerobaculia bacterium]|nr:ATP-binding protein [Thermoanaerobaculia bacterium]
MIITTLETHDTAGQVLTIDELTRLFGVLSHDLKSPIFSIDGFSDLLLGDYTDKLDEEGQDFLRRIRSSANQMKKVLDEMSHLVKLLARPNAPRPTPLREIVEEVILKCNYQIEEGAVKIDIPDDLPTVNVDPEKMREAIGALFSNALFFNDRPKGERTIAIDCNVDPDGYRLCVRDNGIGIDPRYTNQIFDLGLKLDKSRGGGPGYGLYLAKRIVESHGGSISVDSVPDQGSTVCLIIPR